MPRVSFSGPATCDEDREVRVLEKPRQVEGKVQHAGPGGARLGAWSQQTNSIRFSCWMDIGQYRTVVFQ